MKDYKINHYGLSLDRIITICFQHNFNDIKDISFMYHSKEQSMEKHLSDDYENNVMGNCVAKFTLKLKK
jgi:hypothetical protein